jgi:ATP phosphoribosyltransferase
MIRIALPNKGRLSDGARDLLERAGWRSRCGTGRCRRNLGADFVAIFVNARDIPEFVADGAADFGITGGDIVAESGRPGTLAAGPALRPVPPGGRSEG